MSTRPKKWIWGMVWRISSLISSRLAPAMAASAAAMQRNPQPIEAFKESTTSTRHFTPSSSLASRAASWVALSLWEMWMETISSVSWTSLW